jgi:hypothetical protein
MCRYGLAGDVRCNAIGLGDILLFINVDLGEGDVVGTRELRGELIVDRGDRVAWSAPLCVD